MKKQEQKWKDKSFRDKVESIMGVFGGKYFWDLWIFYTVVLVWVLVIIPHLSKYPITGGLLAIFFLIVIISKIIMIMIEAGIFDNQNKKDEKLK